MYHSRTKKVASYGRRAQRVVAVSGDRRFSSDALSGSVKKQSDAEQAPYSSLENDINEDIFTYPAKSRLPTSLTANHNAFRRPVAASSPQKVTGKKRSGVKSTPARRPLGLYQPNVPNSPAVPPKALQARGGNEKGTPRGLRKVSNISPYVDVDIVVLDDTGRRLSEERRVTRTNVQVNDIDGGVAKAAKRARRPTSVKSYAIFASEEDDDDDEEYIPVSKTSKGKRDAKGPTLGSSSRKSGQPVQKARNTHVPGKEPPLDDSDSRLPRRPKASRRAARPVVVTDSESESSAEVPSKAGQARKTEAKRVSSVHHARVAEHTTKQTSRTLIGELPHPTQTTCEVEASFPPASQVPNKPHGDPEAFHTKKSAVTSTSNRDVSIQKKADHDMPSQGYISVESDTPRSRPRQLMPNKPSRLNTAFFQQRPARFSPSRVIVLSDDDDSLSIDEELELALQIAEVQLAKSSHPSPKPSVCQSYAIGPSGSTSKLGQRLPPCSRKTSQRPHLPSYLRPLLSECGQLTPFDFSTFIETFPVDPIISFSDHTGFSENFSNDSSFLSFQKVGEASYSEVFGIGNVVLKVVPLLDEENDVSATWTADWDSPPVSEAKDVLKEIVVTRAMGDICKGFIKLLKVHVVQGPYPHSLLALWDKYDDIKGSESVRPDHFSPTQTYAIIILPNGGPDLENFSFGPSSLIGGIGWRQACSIFWQVARSLGNAEQLVHFEHRDLHWGQILVRNTKKSPRSMAISSRSIITLDDPSHGVQSTIIDLGLARIDQGQGESFWTPFTEEIFEGEGDYQYDIYRMMRKHNKDDWQSFRPLTNVMWLHYLVDKLLNHKHIRAPTRSPGRRSRKSVCADANLAIAEADRRAYDCLVEVEWALGISIASVARNVGAKAKKRSKLNKEGPAANKIDETPREVKSAGDVLHLGKERGWIL